jgi:signal transduction histidine kinase
MSSQHPAPPRWSGRLTRSWDLLWRLGFALLVGAAAFAVQYGTAVDVVGPDGADSVKLLVLMTLDLVAAPIALGLLAWRRRPAAGAAIVLLSAFSSLSVGAGILAAVSFAAAQSTRRVVVLGLAFTALATSALPLVPDPAGPLWAEALGVAVLYALLVLVGRYVRSRRQLVASLQAQAQSTRREQEALADSARSAERARIAREMHDALGHRLSVIAMHAGALESRADLSPADTRMAAGVVRESAHQAMGELRQVLDVLHEASSTRSGGSDVPTLAQLDELVGTGVGHGAVPELRWEADVRAVPESVSRHLYRIAQEALTNVRKHAPGQPTLVVVRSPTRGAVELEVRNRLPTPVTAMTPARLHHGLAGLAERARLAGGSMTAGPEDVEFVVRAVLPCPS